MSKEASCRYCGSSDVRKDGLYPRKGMNVQRYQCRSCGRRFLDSYERGGRGRPSGERVVKICPVCKQPFVVVPSQRHRKFCSIECYSKTRYKGDKIRDSVRVQVLKRDGYTCQICGRDVSSWAHIHHTGEEDSSSNLITLCPSCHIRAHKSLKMGRRLPVNRTIGVTEEVYTWLHQHKGSRTPNDLIQDMINLYVKLVNIT